MAEDHSDEDLNQNELNQEEIVPVTVMAEDSPQEVILTTDLSFENGSALVDIETQENDVNKEEREIFSDEEVNVTLEESPLVTPIPLSDDKSAVNSETNEEVAPIDELTPFTGNADETMPIDTPISLIDIRSSSESADDFSKPVDKENISTEKKKSYRLANETASKTPPSRGTTASRTQSVGGKKKSPGKFEPTVPKPFNFSLNRRIEDRSKYNEKIKEQKKTQEEKEKKERELREQEEENQIKEMRKNLVYKVNNAQINICVNLTSFNSLSRPNLFNTILQLLSHLAINLLQSPKDPTSSCHQRTGKLATETSRRSSLNKYNRFLSKVGIC
jgi:hypothetical protein